ncbi:hypothetical protein HG530_002274 [Fusarium avenaceum]|nr:hypothetical protein HG530_002274 [Fusarium avenaceum]
MKPKVTRLDNVLHLAIPQTPILDLKINLDSLGLAGIDSDLLETLELVSGNVDRGEHILHVQLHNLGAVTLGLVADIHGNSHGVGRGYVLFGDGDLGEVELAVGQSVAERVQGFGVLEDVVVAEFEGAVLVDFAWVGDIGESMATLLRLVELLDKSRSLLGDPGLGDGLAGTEHYDGRLASVDDGFNELGHGADQVQFVLVASPGSDDDDSNVCGFSSGDGVLEAGIVVGPALAALGEGDFALTGGLDTIIRSNAAAHGSVDDIVAILTNVTVGHGADNSDIGVLLQGKDVLVVFQENDTLGVKLAGNLLVGLGVDIVPDLVICNTSEGLLKETHLELGAKNSGHSCVDNLLLQLASLDKLWDDLKTPVATAHLGIVTSRKSL